jgi:CHAD domain-containing protein
MHSAELSILLHRALMSRLEVLMAGLAREGWQADPDGLHDNRVASRRVRAVLDMLEPALYPRLRRHGGKLKRLTRALGRTREMDVHLGLLRDLAAREARLGQGPVMEHLLEVIDGQRARALKAMARDLERIKLKSLPGLLLVPSLPDPFRVADLAGDIWGCLAPWLEGTFAPQGLLDQEDVPALHALRVRIKRLRYALEVLAPGFDAAPEAELKHLRQLQTALGDHHDLVTLTDLLEALLQGLEARDRPILAAGTREILAHLQEERAIAFEQFRALALAADREGFIAGLQGRLGLPAAAEDGASS